jgi:plastocyanin
MDRRTFLAVGTAGIVAGVVGRRSGLSQGATPASLPQTPHPAHIHAGTCDELGDVVFPLNDVASIAAEATPAAVAGAGDAVARSATTVDASLDELLAAEHAINVHESAENIGTYIACGNLTGPATDGELLIALEELNGSGYAGEAHLVDNGDGTTTVTVTLMSTGTLAGTPVAAHAGHDDPGAVVEVVIKGFVYQPDPVTISVGQTVTWTNQDVVPHTATARDREMLQSGTLGQGESYSQAFDAPGTYEYFCEFHAGMKGVVVVEG